MEQFTIPPRSHLTQWLIKLSLNPVVLLTECIISLDELIHWFIELSLLLLLLAMRSDDLKSFVVFYSYLSRDRNVFFFLPRCPSWGIEDSHFFPLLIFLRIGQNSFYFVMGWEDGRVLSSLCSSFKFSLRINPTTPPHSIADLASLV